MYAAAKSWTEQSYNWDEQIYEDFGDDSGEERNFSPLIQHLL